jgi:hypothetical protein
MHALLLALLAASPPALVSDDDDLRSDEEPRPEETVSGAASAELLFPPVPQLTVTVVRPGQVFQVSGGAFPSRGVSDAPQVSANAMAGWNWRALGGDTDRAGMDVDLRLLAGVSFNIPNWGFFYRPVFGFETAFEAVITSWVNERFAVSAGVLGGVDLVMLAWPDPCARLTLGVTF